MGGAQRGLHVVGTAILINRRFKIGDHWRFVGGGEGCRSWRRLPGRNWRIWDWRLISRRREETRFEITESGHPTDTNFREKQSQQVIENTELRPRIGQNKPNFGHFSWAREGLKPRGRSQLCLKLLGRAGAFPNKTGMYMKTKE